MIRDEWRIKRIDGDEADPVTHDLVEKESRLTIPKTAVTQPTVCSRIISSALSSIVAICRDPDPSLSCASQPLAMDRFQS
jgi:hypothetical protein